MSTKFNMIRDINGYNGFGLPFAYDVYNTTLAANTAQSVTVPSNFEWWLAIMTFDPGTSVWVSNSTTATVPGGSVASTTCQQNPPARLVKGGSHLSFITSDTTAQIGVSFYAVNENGVGAN